MSSGPGTRRSMRAEYYCGAKTRKGRRCRVYKLKGRKRCRVHAGLSTGPRTEEGKARVAEAQRKAWAAWRASLGLSPDWRYDSSRRRGGRKTAAQCLAENTPESAE